MKEEIKSWLKSENHEREWLAEQLGVNKRTVDNWLSSPKEIPSGKLTRIKRLMEDDAAAAEKRSLQLRPQAQFFSLEVNLPRFRAYSAAALAAGKTLEQWCIDSLNELAAEYHRTGQMPDIRETKSTVAGVPVRILESAAPSLHDVVGTPGDTGLILGDYFIAPGHKRMILMADHKHDGVWLAGVDDHLDEDWCGSRAEFDAAGWTRSRRRLRRPECRASASGSSPLV